MTAHPRFCRRCGRLLSSAGRGVEAPSTPTASPDPAVPTRATEPFQPGWYPAGDGVRQQYYAGRDRGWRSDRYLLEIELRDPLRPPLSSRRTNDRAQLLLSMVVFIAMVLVLAVVMVAIIGAIA